MPEPMEHASNRNAFEKILRWIPFFRGYLRKEDRREADHLQRTWLADRLERAKRGLNQYMKNLANAAQIDELPTCENLRTRLDHVITRLRSAVRGYSGMFDFVKVKEDLLDQVYQHEVGMMSEVDALAEKLEALAKNTSPPSAVIFELVDNVNAIHEKVDQREDLLKGLGKT